ncbi:penicillin-binding protein 2 [Exiguobacterium sp. ZOR0005]|uniref:peptidoglycan D,D-transpeptidase FtsI family protein n=1 Tax=Exiguobacterium sp. ZOR0005 TaxID=1339226 RepID=UPI00068FB158|nr:penicillin-binding protein 2 [Exiguobacterium sp. ZOR0005]
MARHRVKVPKKRRNHLPLRLNLLFFIVFMLFATLIFRLGVVQIVNGELIAREVQKTESSKIKYEVPRGKIYDRNGQVLADTISNYSVMYRRSQVTKTEERLDVAVKLAEILDVPEKDRKVTERDRKDYWIAVDPDRSRERVQALLADLSEEARAALSNQDVDQLLLDSITDEEIAFDDATEEIIAIKHNMESGYALDPQLIKVGASPKEIALIEENLELLPGVSVEPYYQREYPFGQTFQSFLGSYRQIPAEQRASYQAKGYGLNDRVGTSYLEQQYEDVLRGTPAYDVFTTYKGQPVGEPTRVSGNPGKDIVLSTDIVFQKEVDEILQKAIRAGRAGSPNFDRAFVVVMNPQTGELLALSGQELDLETNEFKDVSTGTVLRASQIGSTIKGATVAFGLEEGVIRPGEYIYDTPIRIGSSLKSSYRNMGNINDLDALALSSNIYMFQIALRLADYYSTGQIVGENVTEAFNTMEHYYKQFGLGIETGIDLPFESTGFRSVPDRVTLLMDMSIGQFISYTPIQLAQYTSALANGGYRVQPHLLKEIIEPGSLDEENKQVVSTFQPNALNKVNIRDEYIERVRQGYRQGVESGTSRILQQTGMTAAGKTGTAQAIAEGPDGQAKRNANGEPIKTFNSNHVGWAPYDNPEIAWAIIMPGLEAEGVNTRVAHDIMKAYFNLEDVQAQLQ